VGRADAGGAAPRPCSLTGSFVQLKRRQPCTSHALLQVLILDSYLVVPQPVLFEEVCVCVCVCVGGGCAVSGVRVCVCVCGGGGGAARVPPPPPPARAARLPVSAVPTALLPSSTVCSPSLFFLP
jgi:hypothetical protein